MAAPTVVGVGAVASGTTAITLAFPTETLADNDVLVGIGESVGTEAYPLTAPLANGWAHVTGSPAAQASNTRLTVIWRRFVTGDVAQSWGDPGNHAIGRIIAVRGCISTGSPWSVAAAAVQSTATTTATWPGVADTGSPDCLVLECIATGRDANSTANLGALTNAGYSSITERMDNWTSSGTGGGIGMVSGVQATQGPTGQSTATMGSTDTKAYMTLVLWPEPTGDTPIPGDPMPLGRKARAVIVG
jgi:hypothetical protein